MGDGLLDAAGTAIAGVASAGIMVVAEGMKISDQIKDAVKDVKEMVSGHKDVSSGDLPTPSTAGAKSAPSQEASR